MLGKGNREQKPTSILLYHRWLDLAILAEELTLCKHGANVKERK